MLPLVVRRLAGADIRTAHRWYERERAGTGDDFIDELDYVFSRIQHLDRPRALEQLAAGELDAVCTVDMFNEGVDVRSRIHIARRHAAPDRVAGRAPAAARARPAARGRQARAGE